MTPLCLVLLAACFAGTAMVVVLWAVAAVLARLEGDEAEVQDEYSPQDS